MGKEIERKFLVSDKSFESMAVSSTDIRQTYLSVTPDATVRIRIADDNAWLTVKSRNHGAVRGEWEYAVPASDAREMMDACCGCTVSKRRYIVPYCGRNWEVDVFSGHLAGLIVAEIELQHEDEAISLPPFAGREVTGDTRYYNSCLSDPSSPLPPLI